MDGKMHRHQRRGRLCGHPNGGSPRPGRKAAYEVYLRRLCERHRVGEQADRLVRIVDKHLPNVAAENRAYVMRYPHKVHVMLKKAWALRRRLRAKKKQKKGEKEAKRGRGDRDAATPTEPTTPEQAERPQDERGNLEPQVTKEASNAEAAAPTEPMAPEYTERPQDERRNLGPHVTKAASVSEDTPPDWGCEEEESSPDGQGMAGTVGAQWPWGPAGRPSDQEAGQMRPSEPAGGPPHKASCLTTNKPSEPAGEPPVQPQSQHRRGGETQSYPSAELTLRQRGDSAAS